MATEKQIAANRRNAARSTGPKTASGKARSAANARYHGFTVEVPKAEVTEMMALILGLPATELAKIDAIQWEATCELARAELDLKRIRDYQVRLGEKDLQHDMLRLLARYRAEAESGCRTARRAWTRTMKKSELEAEF